MLDKLLLGLQNEATKQLMQKTNANVGAGRLHFYQRCSSMVSQCFALEKSPGYSLQASKTKREVQWKANMNKKKTMTKQSENFGFVDFYQPNSAYLLLQVQSHLAKTNDFVIEQIGVNSVVEMFEEKLWPLQVFQTRQHEKRNK